MHRLRQLRNVNCDTPRLIFAEQLDCAALARLMFEIKVSLRGADHNGERWGKGTCFVGRAITVNSS